VQREIKRMFVILYDDGTTCLTKWKPDLKNDTDIVAIREVQICEGDGIVQL
jgi:hypothetical protein